MEYIDIHTHKNYSITNITSVLNFYVPEVTTDLEEFENSKFPDKCSIGIHPWFTNSEVFNSQFNVLRNVLKNQKVFAIGECGLDRLKGPDLSFQEEIFLKQIRLAEEFNKPVIIHSVRCNSELLSIMKIIKPKVPMIIHGFTGSLQMAQNLIEKGYYLSFGKFIMDENSNLKEVLPTVDLSRCFFETDDSDYQIIDIYKKAANILKIEIEDLKNILQTNFIELSIYE